MPTRDTSYATELATSVLRFPGGDEGRIERLLVKEFNQEEIRCSWWKDGRMMMRPLDLPEKDLLALLRAADLSNAMGDKAKMRQSLMAFEAAWPKAARSSSLSSRLKALQAAL